MPGFLCDARVFAHQVQALSEHDHVASVTVADVTRQTSIGAMAAAVLEATPGRFVVIGLSMGAIVAAEIAATAPDRLAGVAVLDTNLDRPDDAQLAVRRRWQDRVAAGELEALVRAELVEPLTADPDQHGPIILDMALAAGADTFVRQNEALLHRRDRRDDLASLTVPVLVACGRDDRICPPHLHRDLTERTPRARLVVVDGAGHLSTIDQPEALTRALEDWLMSCTSNHHQPPTGGTIHDYTTA